MSPDVPDDVAALLIGLGLGHYGAALCKGLGVTCAADLRLLTDALLSSVVTGMQAEDRARLLAAVAALGAQPPAVAPPVHGGGAEQNTLRAQRNAAAPDGAGNGAANGAYDVFMSYRTAETGGQGDGSVFALQAVLRRHGFRVFVTEQALEPGGILARTVQDALRGCRAVVVLCSPTYGDQQSSPWTHREMAVADSLRKPVIPVWHSGVYPPPAVSIYLGHRSRLPSGNFPRGYVAAGVNHDDVADQLAAALTHMGVQPSLAA